MKRIHLLSGPILAMLAAWLCHLSGLEGVVVATVAVTVVVVVWWITEALPIPVTALVPVVMFPAFGVIDYKTAASSFGNHLIILMMGAFMMSRAIEKCGVHRRLALYTVGLFGADNSRFVVLGFMAAAAFLSMWVSNTATTLMLFPIALAVAGASRDPRFAMILLLGIAYAASIGGVGTPIGTPPNVVFMSVYSEHFGVEQSFADWMKVGLPVTAVGVPVAAFWLVRNLRLSERLTLPAVGVWEAAEKRVLMVFALVALAWIFRKAPFGGWTGLIGAPQIGDSTISLAGVVLMCLISDGKKGRLLDWKTAGTIPWGIILLFAGGICIAKAFQASGLSQLLGDQLSVLSTWPVFLMILALCLGVTFLTEVTSNTATTALLMPVLAVAALAAGIDPRLFMIPAAISASCAFMLPVATPPNAVVYGSGKFTIKEMAREGFGLNLIMALVISVLCYFLIG